MASSLSCLARRALLNRVASASFSSSVAAASRLFSTTSPAFARRSLLEEDISVADVMEYIGNSVTTVDSPTAGHLRLQEERIVRHYFRLIENEMPKLVALRKPFTPPTSTEPLIVRSTNYIGDSHPVEVKKSVVVAVDDLPLDDVAKKRLVLLAGPRWTPNPPTDAGISKYAEWGNGFIKIACEDYPQPAQNLKWISDTLDKLIERAKVPNKDWEDLPVDLRHVYSKSRKAKKGEHLQGRILAKPTLRDFPQEWLPKTPTNEQPVPSLS